MSFKFGWRSEETLDTIHPDLVRVFRGALQTSQLDFGVIEGARSLRSQTDMVAAGRSLSINSRHLLKTPQIPIQGGPNDGLWAHAGDIMAYRQGKPTWDWGAYAHVSKHVFDAARSQDVEVVWGGHWVNLSDGPHFELSWDKYPIIE